MSDMKNIETIKIDFADLYNEFQPFKDCKYSKLLQTCVFRGESSLKYKLLPSILCETERSKWLNCSFIAPHYDKNLLSTQIFLELVILKKFYDFSNKQGLSLPKIPLIHHDEMMLMLSANFSKWLPEEWVELAALAQHYGTPTRLLDWSFNFKTALYFMACSACKKIKSGSAQSDDKMVLWALNKRHIDILNYTKDHNTDLCFTIPAYALNPNIQAQQGVLTFWKSNFCKFESSVSLSIKPLDELISTIEGASEPLLYKFEIPISDCFAILTLLSIDGVNSSTIFPGFSGVSKALYDDAFYIKHGR